MGKLVRLAVLAGIAAIATKVVKDIIKADEEEKNIISLDQEESEKETEE